MSNRRKYLLNKSKRAPKNPITTPKSSNRMSNRRKYLLNKSKRAPKNPLKTPHPKQNNAYRTKRNNVFNQLKNNYTFKKAKWESNKNNRNKMRNQELMLVGPRSGAILPRRIRKRYKEKRDRILSKYPNSYNNTWEGKKAKEKNHLEKEERKRERERQRILKILNQIEEPSLMGIPGPPRGMHLMLGNNRDAWKRPEPGTHLYKASIGGLLPPARVYVYDDYGKKMYLFESFPLPYGVVKGNSSSVTKDMLLNLFWGTGDTTTPYPFS